MFMTDGLDGIKTLILSSPAPLPLPSATAYGPLALHRC